MKKFIQIIILLCATATVQAQFNYQATVRNGNGDLLSNEAISFRTTILNSDIAEYVETHAVTTSESGLVNFKIGLGTPTIGDFTSIVWSDENFSLKVELDIDGGTNFTDLGTTELSYVPFAEHTNTADTATLAIIAKEATTAETAVLSKATNSVLSVTNAERDALSLEVGQLVYNSESRKFQGVVLNDGSQILDQKVDDTPNSGNAVSPTVARTGQEFIATKEGTLTQIDVSITSVSAPGTFNLVIYRGGTDYFNNVPAYTKAFSVTTADWYEITLDTPLAVEKDENLVWSVEYISSGSIGIGRVSGDPYPSGRSCIPISCGAGCCDLNFRSFISSNEPTWIDLH